MKRISLITFIYVLLLQGQLYATVEQPIKLNRDPFKRPLNPNFFLLNNSLNDIKENAKANLKVKGVLLGKSAMANINGKILAIGDLIEGYRLISVDLEKAVLEKGNFIIEIPMDEKR